MLGIYLPHNGQHGRHIRKVFQVSIYLLSGQYGRHGGEREVDTGIGYQICLELVQIHVQAAVKPQGRRDGRHDLNIDMRGLLFSVRMP